MNTIYLALAVLAVVTQAYSQCIPSCATGIAPVYAPNCGCPAPALVAAPAPTIVAAPGPVIASAPYAAPAVIAGNSVAANLADTLSLLTVTTLLAETLPYSCAAYPQPIGYPACGSSYGYLL